MMCFSGLVAMLLLIAGFFLVQIFLGSAHASDQPIGYVMGAIILTYIIGPAFLVRWFYVAERFAAASLTLALWNVVGVTAILLVMGGISAGARP